MIDKISAIIVDDELEIRNGLTTLLDWDKYNIDIIGTADNGNSAYDMILKYSPDIVITDISMPFMNGLDLIEKVSEIYDFIYFIILSGYDDFEYAKKAIKYNVNDYLLKPINIKEFENLISNLVDKIKKERILTEERLFILKNLEIEKKKSQEVNFISQLLKNELNSDEIENFIMNLPIKNIKSQVVLFKYHLNNIDYANNAKRYTIRKSAFLKKTLDEFLLNENAITYNMDNNSILLLFNLETEKNTQIEIIINKFINYILNKSNIIIYASLGKPVHDLTCINNSYSTAGQALAWHIYTELGNTLDYHLLEIKEPKEVIPVVDIIENLLQEDYKELMNSISIFFDKLTLVSTPPPRYIYSMCNYLIICLQRDILKYKQLKLKSFVDNSYEILQQLESFDKIKEWTEITITSFIDEIKISNMLKKDVIIDQIIEFVEENIYNKIKLEDIASHVGFSKNYLTVYFKNKTNINLRNYILDLKISYAKEQLKNAKNKPGDIAILLGYEEYRSFNRAFKSKTGLAPSLYQEKYNKKS